MQSTVVSGQLDNPPSQEILVTKNEQGDCLNRWSKEIP
jgi:hypothetical protein